MKMVSRNAGGVKNNGFLSTLFGFERARSKRNILFIVLIHLLAWCIFFFIPVLLYPVRINDSRFLSREMLNKSLLVLFFYANYYWLIPRLFEKRKYFSYLAIIFLAFLIYLFQNVLSREKYVLNVGGPLNYSETNIIDPKQPGVRGQFRTNTGFRSFGGKAFKYKISTDSANAVFPPFPPIEPWLFGLPRGVWLMTLNNALSSFTLVLLMGGFIRLAHSFIRNQNEKKALENANLNAEVNFLKSQINPHFLFNTLNGIYAQAHSRSDKTEYSILKLSELLRYVLYDSSENKVSLALDIKYITNYIDLQKIRLSSKVRIFYEVNGNIEGQKIAPLLLINFIENAFKHGISYAHPSTIRIIINVIDNKLEMIVSNPYVSNKITAKGGLGLKNVSRRLELLYPSKFDLQIQPDETTHTIYLKIILNND